MNNAATYQNINAIGETKQIEDWMKVGGNT